MFSTTTVEGVTFLFVSVVFVFASEIYAVLRPPNPESPQPSSGSVLRIYENAAVCSDSTECSEIGRNTLQQGGSAVDAALAMLLCNGLLGMQAMGLGGGMLMNVYLRDENRAYSILGREVAPLKANPSIFAKLHNVSQLLQSAMSIAVPGEVMGYAVAHERFGKLPWAKLVAPTIALCHAGYTLSKHQRDALQSNVFMVSKDMHLRKMFIDSQTGEFHRTGSHINPSRELCRTYESLANDGPKSFYKGELAQQIASDLEDFGSSISLVDLNTFKVPLVPSILLPLGDHILHLTPPPGSGYILGLVMNILHKFECDFLRAKVMGALEIHRIVEALKFGFAKRWQLDLQNDSRLLENITCPDYAAELAALIDDFHNHEDPLHYGANLELNAQKEYGTAHISVLAPNGDAVAVTSSINFYFGSGRTGSRTGVVFNNAMADFSIDGFPNYFDLPSVRHKNHIRPGISPMSSMAPTIVTHKDGGVSLIVGAAGGSKILSALAQLLVRTLWLKEDIKQAIDAARFHHQLLPNVLEYEYGILQCIIESMEAKGHTTERYRVRGSAICGIQRMGNAIFANADYRKEGGVSGF